MQLTSILLLVFSLHVTAGGYSQTITFSGSKVPLEKVFSSIEEQTGMVVVWNRSLVSDTTTVTAQVKEIQIEAFLSLILKNAALDFLIEKQTIIVKAKQSARNIFPNLDSPPITVSGRIINEKGEPVIATVSIKDTRQGATSNTDGTFEIFGVRENAVLIITAANIETQEIQLSKHRTTSTNKNLLTITISVVTKSERLNEIVVNKGYYSESKKLSTGSVSKVSSEEIARQPVPHTLATVQGRMAGVNVVQESGIAGAGFKINIRGVNSLREEGNEPLYVIDGVPYSTDPISYAQTSTSIPGNGNPLNSINPGDIESLEILKDADATAIYGSRGANGVVLITTKRGKTGKSSVVLNTNRSFGKVTRMMPLMNTGQYLAMRKKAFENDGIASYPASAYDVNGRWDSTRYTDWQKTLLGGTADVFTTQGTVSGGSEQTRYLFSGNYRTESSVFPGDFLYKKGGGRMSFDHNSIDGRFMISLAGGYTVQDNDLPWIDFVNMSRSLAPNAPALYTEEGKLNWEDNTWSNPLGDMENKSRSTTSDLITSGLLSYRLARNLFLKSSFGFTDLRNRESRSMPTTAYNPAYNLGSEYSSIYTNNVSRNSWIVEPQLTWKTIQRRSTVEMLLGGTFQQVRGDRLVQLGRGFSSNSLIYDMSAAANVLVMNNEQTTYKYQAFFGRINYTLDERYILNVTGRRDGSSRFGPGKQFAWFGAAGGAWLFYKARLFDDLPWLSFGKLLMSYGTTGNDKIGDYQYLDTYISSGYLYQNTRGLRPARLFNPDFGWETNNKWEASLELGMFNDRLFFTSAYYRNRSSSQLVGLPLPGTTGFTSIQSNLDATVQNTGLEITLRLAAINNGDWRWTTSINWTRAKNKLIAFPGLEYSTYKNDYVIGEPTTITKLFHATGVDPVTGVYTYEDVNKDGVISYDMDRQTLRDFNPDFYGGFQNQLSYKGLQLDFLFQFVKQENFNFANTKQYAGLFTNQPVQYVNAWQKPGDQAPYQLYTSGSNQEAMRAGGYFGLSDGAVGDASFIRLKNLSLSYDLPRKWLRGTGCRLSFQGQNLLTFTAYEGADPEFVFGAALPPLRILSAGLQLTF